jgi:hypothetical protein
MPPRGRRTCNTRTRRASERASSHSDDDDANVLVRAHCNPPAVLVLETSTSTTQSPIVADVLTASTAVATAGLAASTVNEESDTSDEDFVVFSS